MNAFAYLDHAATTPPDPRVVAEMSAVLAAGGANPSAIHAAGRAAAERIEAARATVAALVGASPRDLTFTSGATEANNLAILGHAQAWATLQGRPGHLVSLATEHKSVLMPLRRLKAQGWRVTLLQPSRDGRLAPEALAAVIEPDTALASFLWVNNETGVRQDVAALLAVCHAHGVATHVDAAQAAAKEPVRVDGIDYLVFTAHKFGGPQGIGALVVAPVAPRADHAADPGRRAGARSALRHAGRASDRGIRRRLPPRGRRGRDRSRATGTAARAALGGPRGSAGRAAQRACHRARLRHPRTSRSTAWKARASTRVWGARRLTRLGLRLRQRRALVRAARHGPRSRGRAELAALQPGRDVDRGGRRPRHQPPSAVSTPGCWRCRPPRRRPCRTGRPRAPRWSSGRPAPSGRAPGSAGPGASRAIASPKRGGRPTVVLPSCPRCNISPRACRAWLATRLCPKHPRSGSKL